MNRLLFFLFCLLPLSHFAQRIIMPKPEAIQLPPAMAMHPGWCNTVVSPNGRYLCVYSDNEARIWRLPDGELIYRFQSGVYWMNGEKRTDERVRCEPVRSVGFTPDSRYFGFTGFQCGTSLTQGVELESGELVPSGPMLDYWDKFFQPQWPRTLTPERYTAMLGKRSGSDLFARPIKEVNERVEMLDAVSDPADPTRVLVFFRQKYYGDRRWRKQVGAAAAKEKADEFEKEVHKFNSYTDYQLWDYHYASVGKNLNDVRYIGKLREGVSGVDFPDTKFLEVSPDAQHVLIHDGKSNESILVRRLDGKGKPWTLGGDAILERFAPLGTVWFLEDTTSDGIIHRQRSLATGEVLREVSIPQISPTKITYLKEITGKTQLLPEWGLVAVLRPLGPAKEDGTSVALHDLKTGRMLMPLVDVEAVQVLAKESGAALKQLADERAERIRAYYAWQAEWKAQEIQQEAERMKRDEAARSAKEAEEVLFNSSAYEDCAMCKGKGTIRMASGLPTSKVTYEGMWSREVTTTYYSEDRPCSWCGGKGRKPRR